MSAAQGGRLDVVSTALSPFHLKLGKASKEIPALAKELAAKAVVCDMSPLRVPKQWASDVAKACEAQEARAHGHGKAVTKSQAEGSQGPWRAAMRWRSPSSCGGSLWSLWRSPSR